MLEIRNWSKAYGHHRVLDQLCLKVDKGQVLTIIGPSGSGKSTFLRTINFIEPADQGQIRIDQTHLDVEEAKEKEILRLRRQTAMVFQNYALFSKKTALENVMEHDLMVNKMDRPSAQDKAMAYLQRVDMEAFAHLYPHQLSGGQQQRIGIARALAIEPKVMLLDEPTSALDPELVGGILQLIQSIAHQEMTLLLVTHEMKFARQVSDQVIFLDQGRIIEQGSSQEIFDQPQVPRTQAFLQSIY